MIWKINWAKISNVGLEIVVFGRLHGNGGCCREQRPEKWMKNELGRREKMVAV